MKRRTPSSPQSSPTFGMSAAERAASNKTKLSKGQATQSSSDAENLRRVCIRSVALFLIAAIGVMRVPGGEKHADRYMRELYTALGGSFIADPDFLFVTVRTTQCHHNTRVKSILNTYWKFAPESIVFFTDTPPSPNGGKWKKGCKNDYETIIQLDPPLANPTRDRFSLVNTLCSPTHQIEGFCCKTTAEIMYYYEHSSADWMCHVDDDTYLNYPEMVSYLKQYDPTQEHYIGFPPTANDIETAKKRRKNMFTTAKKEYRPLKVKANITISDDDDTEYKRVTYATGRNGWCMSRPLVERGFLDFPELMVECMSVVYPDDVSLGYLIQEKLKGPKMKSEPRLNAEKNAFASRNEAKAQLTIASRKNTFASWPGLKIVDKQTGAPPENDPLGFKAMHCSFYPNRC